MDKLDSKPLFNIVSGITILCIIVAVNGIYVLIL